MLRHRGLSFPSTQEQTNNKRLVQNYRPLGVVGVITPYNFPTDISSIALAHIVAAGNTVVWKPSEYAAVSCTMVAEIFQEAGLPAGVINVVHGAGDVGAAVSTTRTSTGSSSPVRPPRVNASRQRRPLRPHLLELGGDGPFIILHDADIDAAVEGAINGCFYYAGQVCTSAERVLVHEDVHDEFVAKFLASAAQIVVGDPATRRPTWVRYATRRRSTGCTHTWRTPRPKGPRSISSASARPLLPGHGLDGCHTEMRIAQEETFGPSRRSSRSRRYRRRWRSPTPRDLGLIASLWTKDLATAWRVGEALQHGTVNINETSNYWDQLAPFGGASERRRPRTLAVVPPDASPKSKLLVFDLGDSEVRYDRRAEGGW